MPDLSAFASDLDLKTFPACHQFFRTGDDGDVMYVVVSGAAEITLRGTSLEVVDAGGIFGEMALIDHRERSADVTSLTEVEVAAIDQEHFLFLVRTHPNFALDVMKIMTQRLRHFDDLI